MHPPILGQRQVQQRGSRHIPTRHMLGKGSGIAGQILGKFHVTSPVLL
jgi:hypothetical protein